MVVTREDGWWWEVVPGFQWRKGERFLAQIPPAEFSLYVPSAMFATDNLCRHRRRRRFPPALEAPCVVCSFCVGLCCLVHEEWFSIGDTVAHAGEETVKSRWTPTSFGFESVCVENVVMCGDL